MLSLTAAAGRTICAGTNAILRKTLSLGIPSEAKVAVVLSGCGVYDGTEIHEASAVLVHLSRNHASVSMFAPDIDQTYTINHLRGEPMEPKRNVLLESARIARGKISDLSELKASAFDAVIFPGGFGAAKNLSSFAVDGPDMKVIADVERILKEFHEAKKPVGLCCIAPVLAAKVIPGCEVTVGSDKEGDRWPYATATENISKLGAKHINKEVTEAHIDLNNRIVTSPAFMCETSVHEVFDGIGEMVEGVLRLVN
ncbi:glutamine amidotransferase-like class 1 domain-containing protein 3A, mitochondrial isoform X1 [Argonauta hians]